MRLMSRFAALVATGMLLMFLLMQQLDPSGAISCSDDAILSAMMRRNCVSSAENPFGSSSC